MEQRGEDFDWSDFFYAETLVDIAEAIVAMEEELVKAMKLEFGVGVVVNPFWWLESSWHV